MTTLPNTSGKSPGISSNTPTPLPNMHDVHCLMPEAMDVFKSNQSAPIIDKRPFECTICGNRFRQQCHLTQHIRIHTNDRPYHCSHCEKAFKQKSQLNQHERIHTGEKPYQCPLCVKAFPQAGQLYSHKKTHGIDPRVNKDPRNGIDVPKRGRKRKNKDASASVVFPNQSSSVAYLIEPLHRQPPPHYANHGFQQQDVKKSKENCLKQTQDSPQLSHIEKHIDMHLMQNMKMETSTNPAGGPVERHKLIPVSRDQYQAFLHSQFSYQDQLVAEQRARIMSMSTGLPPTSTLTYNESKQPNSVEHPKTSTHIENRVDKVPAHLKDLERLIPSCDQT